MSLHAGERCGEPLSCGYVAVCIGSRGLIVLTLLTIR
jgi:hypothetical protein